ncbi:hypothetical protein FSW04_08425 [Baekduia soli]|uniref:Uncharacterized protein n=1 Tax=Baekduia soli TaxID=496014 RepID=A0A5B8U3Z7_9ACTN|nr:hypothetical protein [Baekduia soli]QEC47598.1 hypothetical protein FSW04_08425 [Baekduia soli]
MPRIPKRLMALGGLAAAGLAVLRRRRADRPAIPSPTDAAPAPAPPAAPAPPVTPPAPPETASTAAAAAEPATPDSEVLAGRGTTSIDELVDRETAAAAAEAGAIGGPGVDDAHGHPAMEAVYEAGGGESEGFEASEEALIENATHGDGRADPISDAFTPEVEADEVTGRAGEADEERVSDSADDEDRPER